MESLPFSRRGFLRRSALAGAALAGAPLLGGASPGDGAVRSPDYRGPNVILVRFGGGTRRRESIEPATTCSPYLSHELVKRGVLFPRMEIDEIKDVQTSHGEGTLNLLTGRYDVYKDVGAWRPDAGRRFLGARFEAKVPTLFEQLREAYAVPDHEALIVNGEDRSDEEFYNFSNHHLFGVRYRSQTLSLRRYKMWLLREKLGVGAFRDNEVLARRRELAEMEALDYRSAKETGQGSEVDHFWQRWRDYFGDSGLRNERGDRLLTQLTLRALKELKPRLVMINYNDCDYVHWGYLSHYTNGVRIMDEGLRELVAAAEADPFYRDNTIFVVVPDCGRDDNPFMDVPCQHHFGSRASHEIFALMFGTGVPQGVRVDRRVSQVDVAPTVAHWMGMKARWAEGRVLEEAIA